MCSSKCTHHQHVLIDVYMVLPCKPRRDKYIIMIAWGSWRHGEHMMTTWWVQCQYHVDCGDYAVVNVEGSSCSGGFPSAASDAQWGVAATSGGCGAECQGGSGSRGCRSIPHHLLFMMCSLIYAYIGTCRLKNVHGSRHFLWSICRV